MMTVSQASKITGVSIRTLRYYDDIGLLVPSGRTDSGYRYYDEAALEKLRQILLFRELDFPLEEIRRIIGSPVYDRQKALDRQIELLTLKKDRLEKIIKLARRMRQGGMDNMDFSAFNSDKIRDYEQRAREQWGGTEAYREYEKKAAGRKPDKNAALAEEMMSIFARFGEIKNTDPASDDAQALVIALKAFITENYYECTNVILASLGEMYAMGGEFTDNIDSVGGEGTAIFAKRAIDIFCGQ